MQFKFIDDFICCLAAMSAGISSANRLINLKFIDLLEEMTDRFKVEIHAYVLMRNHYHLLIKTNQSNLSRAIQWMGVSYAGWFN
jgi:REP element-mobilizing transposase RayT